MRWFLFGLLVVAAIVSWPAWEAAVFPALIVAGLVMAYVDPVRPRYDVRDPRRNL